MGTHENKLNTPSGFRDLLPEDAAGRQHIIECITRVYTRFGFLPLETPVAEFENILVSENVSDFNLFRLESNNQRQGTGQKEDISLRFDLTVPLARVVSQYGNALPRPFKRYQAGYVFRGERPQKGRYRQFMQFDADIVGTKSIAADSEMIVMISEIMKELSVSDFVIRVNTRTILNILPEFISFPKNLLREVLIVLDKAEKISEDQLFSELRRLRISEDGIKKIKEFSEIADTPEKAIEKLEKFFGDFEEAKPGISELKDVFKNLKSFGITENIIFDMKIIRGFSYYTGIVFETNLTQALHFGSVVSGGRYDNLVERFMNQSLPAVGVSVGVDRFETALRELGYLNNFSYKKILVCDIADTNFALNVSVELRKNNVVDLYVGSKKDMKSIFQYAENTRADFVCIVGENEEESKIISLKNMSNREETKVPFDSLSSFKIS